MATNESHFNRTIGRMRQQGSFFPCPLCKTEINTDIRPIMNIGTRCPHCFDFVDTIEEQCSMFYCLQDTFFPFKEFFDQSRFCSLTEPHSHLHNFAFAAVTNLEAVIERFLESHQRNVLFRSHFDRSSANVLCGIASKKFGKSTISDIAVVEFECAFEFCDVGPLLDNVETMLVDAIFNLRDFLETSSLTYYLIDPHPFCCGDPENPIHMIRFNIFLSFQVSLPISFDDGDDDVANDNMVYPGELWASGTAHMIDANVQGTPSLN